jgi:excisionase family DNA binding protein
MGNKEVQTKDKYCLTVEEAAAYFNIGEKSLRKIIADNSNADFLLRIGVKVLIKRKLFEEYVDSIHTI